MKKDHLKLAGAILIISLLAAGCGAAKSEPAPTEQEEQTQVAEAPAAEEPAAEAPAAEETAAEEAQEPATTEVMPATESSEQQNEPEEDVIPEGSEVNESELEDGTKCTEIIKPDGSVKVILESPDGIKTETNYDPQLYPQSRIVFDENGKKTSESTYTYDKDQLDTSWKSTIYYDENGNIEFTSETESIYSEEEGFKYGTEYTYEPDKLYHTEEEIKYGKELLPEPLPISSETVVKDAQGEFVKTISMDIEGVELRWEIVIEYADGSKEKHAIVPIYTKTDNGLEKEDGLNIIYCEPDRDEPYKIVFVYQDGSRQEYLQNPDGSLKEKHKYDADGNLIY